MRKIRAIFFDFDGVLVDSEPLHYDCWSKVLAEQGIHLSAQQYCTCFIGVSNREMIEVLYRRRGREFHSHLFETLYASKRMLYEAIAPVRCQVPSKTKDLIITCLGNYKLGVVSSSNTSEVEPILQASGVRERLSVLVCAELVEKLKPAPDPYRKAIELAGGGIGPGDCLAVEDSAAGAESARAAGLHVLRVRGPGEVADAVRAWLKSDKIDYVK